MEKVGGGDGNPIYLIKVNESRLQYINSFIPRPSGDMPAAIQPHAIDTAREILHNSTDQAPGKDIKFISSEVFLHTYLTSG